MSALNTLDVQNNFIDHAAPSSLDTAKVMHDIGNASGRIRFYCEKLSESVGDGGHFSAQDIKAMSAECAFFLDLIQQLTFRPKGLLEPDHFYDCDVEPLVAYVVERHQNLFDEAIAVELRLSPDTIPFCSAEQNVLYRCISNLLINARQAIKTEGKIVIEVREEKLLAGSICASCRQYFSGDFVRISIADNGCGISAFDQKDIFQTYTTSTSAGSRLGLSIAHELIHQCGGHMKLESIVGAGSRFTLYIPTTFRKVVA